MKRYLHSLVGACALVMGIAVSTAGTAQARSHAASVGRAANWSDGGCFTMNNGKLTNTCSSSKSLHIPLVVDTGGSKTANVTAYGPTSSNNVGCRLVAAPRDGSSTSASPRVYLPGFGSYKVLDLSGANVPSYGYAYVDCTVYYGGVVASVNFNS